MHSAFVKAYQFTKTKKNGRDMENTKIASDFNGYPAIPQRNMKF